MLTLQQWMEMNIFSVGLMYNLSQINFETFPLLIRYLCLPIRGGVTVKTIVGVKLRTG